MGVDYQKVINQISLTYSKSGYSSLWKDMEYLTKKMGNFHFKIIFDVVDKRFLRIRNSKPNTRIFGSFSDDDKKNLVLQCQSLEKKIEVCSI
ncbi:hypothetical protein CMI39_03880 [Candidatus Pacearchaeota archaeon]|jgi:hypothetical protein|nr:hypothetical protein [Candidatus Pacearchaeota archaeon]|tara:strand:+ start:4382 stop:4657 length:276 start_codon:yes stop_codon:yes gene_type:complete